MGTNSLLILKAPEMNQRINKLFENLNEDKSLQSLYLQDPAGVIQKFIIPESSGLTNSEINRGNRMLYSLLSNQKFMKWSEKYESDLIAEAKAATKIENPEEALRAYLVITDRSKIHTDLIEAAAKFSDKEFIAAITWRPERVGLPDPRIPADVAVEIETFVYAVAVAAVFAVAVAAVFAGKNPVDSIFTRVELRDVANRLDTQLQAHAKGIRDKGTLIAFSGRNNGFIR